MPTRPPLDVLLVHPDGRRESMSMVLLRGETVIEGLWRTWPGCRVVLSPDRTEVQLTDRSHGAAPALL
jgi:hypothetical protein